MSVPSSRLHLSMVICSYKGELQQVPVLLGACQRLHGAVQAASALPAL